VKRALLALALLLAAACGGHENPDDQGFHSAFAKTRAGAEVTFDATLLQDPVQSGSHEQLLVRAATGERLEVDHNLGLAPWVPAHLGDSLVVHGQLYFDPAAGVHCTHAHTSKGCPYPGWVRLGETYYE